MFVSRAGFFRWLDGNLYVLQSLLLHDAEISEIIRIAKSGEKIMRVAILETVKTQGGFEQEFDRLIIDELKKEGHEPVLYLPENQQLAPLTLGFLLNI